MFSGNCHLVKDEQKTLLICQDIKDYNKLSTLFAAPRLSVVLWLEP